MSQTFDYIIVGAGSAGCVLANKLSADPKTQVLLIEAGPEDRHPMIHIPKGFAKILGSKPHMYYYDVKPGSGAKKSGESWIRGRVMGGSGSVNGLQYQRGHKGDYEHWEQDLGLHGWGWATLREIFLKLEDHALGANGWRAIGGPVHITQNGNRTLLMDKVIEAAERLGVPRREDPSHPDEEGISYICANVHKGRRWSAVNAFINPIRSRSNLTICTDTNVRRIVFGDRRAVGVECAFKDMTDVLRASREVIVCAGALESPKLLQLSGIGDQQHLSSLGIPVVQHSPDVGQNLREHLIYTTQFRLTGPYSQNLEYSGVRLAINGIKYALTRKGLLASGPYDVTAFVRADPASTRPDAQLVTGPITMDLAKWEGFEKGVPMEKEPGCSMLGYVLRPESQGSLRIQSRDPVQNPEIVHNHLSHEYDRRVAIATARFIRRIFEQPELKPYVKGETLPGTKFQSDDEILEAYSLMGGAGYHAAGTCRMGSDATSVVDERLRVRGVEGLRVVDLSVFPTLVSGNTHAPVMAVAWRGSELILEDGAR
ncbi:GMC family oxidoreductase [Sinimarinibacterium flocculans]|uniref:GMC family oxidoreductase n=1 Tax=Sinimarinibacterium flocculans TaxID=985250 RepID=UPI0024922AEF|nr:GMC family oxidoreductase N-terminal domain-containing protein [Sinimarinibacterium flocculans]